MSRISAYVGEKDFNEAVSLLRAARYIISFMYRICILYLCIALRILFAPLFSKLFLRDMSQFAR